MNKWSAYGSIKKKKNLSKSSLQDPKPEREERLFSTQLISQENNLATEINHFEGNEPEWLMPRGTLFFAFGRGQDFERERGE